jgi:hypothetical protein
MLQCATHVNSCCSAPHHELIVPRLLQAHPAAFFVLAETMRPPVIDPTVAHSVFARVDVGSDMSLCWELYPLNPLAPLRSEVSISSLEMMHSYRAILPAACDRKW